MDVISDVISLVDKLVGVVDEMVTVVTDGVFDLSVEQIAVDSSVFRSAEHYVTHVDTPDDKKFDETRDSLLLTISKSIPIITMLSRIKYVGKREDIVEIFTLDKINSLSVKVKVFNNEVSSAQVVVDSLRQQSDKTSNAGILSQALVDSVNRIADAINECITKHNLFFLGDEQRQIDPVNRVR